MFEVDAIHQGWLEQMRAQLDEVWVPSRWHAASLAAQGVPPAKVVVVPESLDSALADPGLWEPLPLHGRRGFAFLAVFKLEERKGWRELISAYVQVGGRAGPAAAAAAGPTRSAAQRRLLLACVWAREAQRAGAALQPAATPQRAANPQQLSTAPPLHPYTPAHQHTSTPAH
jgi:hypothetical protein